MSTLAGSPSCGLLPQFEQASLQVPHVALHAGDFGNAEHERRGAGQENVGPRNRLVHQPQHVRAERRGAEDGRAAGRSAERGGHLLEAAFDARPVEPRE